MLSYLDTVSTALETVSTGPFSVFQTSPYVHSTPSVSFLRPSIPEIDASLDDKDRLVSSLNAFWNGTHEVASSGRSYSTMEDHSRSPQQDLSTDSDIAIGENMSAPPAAEMALGPPIHSAATLSPRTALYSSLFHDPDTSMLLHHYAYHVAGLLQPVHHPNNPWRTTYFQFALDGRQEYASSSPASTAIFHSVLSSAAFHLRNATSGSKKYHRLGLEHRAKSLHALNAALSHPSKSRVYTLYLTAMLSLVTIDVSLCNPSPKQP